jgi:hypothetical protein
MDFDSAHKFISNQLEIEDENVCHQIDYDAIKIKKQILDKIKCQEDITKLYNNKNVYSTTLNAEYQIRQMFEKNMSIKYQENSHEKKLVQTLITNYVFTPKLNSELSYINEKMKKDLTLSTAIMENTFMDFNNENFLSK